MRDYPRKHSDGCQLRSGDLRLFVGISRTRPNGQTDGLQIGLDLVEAKIVRSSRYQGLRRADNEAVTC